VAPADPAYLKEHALKEMDGGGVDAAILTPHTPWDPKANELCMEAARAFRPVRDPRQLPPRQAREPLAGRAPLYDAFGPARWSWGTDITRMPCPWRQCVTMFTEELPGRGATTMYREMDMRFCWNRRRRTWRR
jgi:hypothetical protein